MPTEQLAYADSVGSAFTQGALTAGALLDSMPSIAGSNLPQDPDASTACYRHQQKQPAESQVEDEAGITNQKSLGTVLIHVCTSSSLTTDARSTPVRR